jgi:hypothetical protein
MSSTKLTPLEWFAEEISKSLQFGFLSRQRYNELREQAKEMEKEKTIDFARHCLDKAQDLDILTSFMNVEQYYNETFKQQYQ